MSLNLGCLSLDQPWHRCKAKLHLHGKAWPWEAHGMGCPTVGGIPFDPLLKLVFARFLLLFFPTFVFSFVFHKTFVDGDFEAVWVSCHSTDVPLRCFFQSSRWNGVCSKQCGHRVPQEFFFSVSFTFCTMSPPCVLKMFPWGSCLLWMVVVSLWLT